MDIICILLTDLCCANIVLVTGNSVKNKIYLFFSCEFTVRGVCYIEITWTMPSALSSIWSIPVLFLIELWNIHRPFYNALSTAKASSFIPAHHSRPWTPAILTKVKQLPRPEGTGQIQKQAHPPMAAWRHLTLLLGSATMRRGLASPCPNSHCIANV